VLLLPRCRCHSPPCCRVCQLHPSSSAVGFSRLPPL
jgi:hypothetical protein